MTTDDDTATWAPPTGGNELVTLAEFLERQRATFAWKTGGLDAEGLRATLGASAMTLGGMLKHLARFENDMTFEWILGGEQIPPWNEVDWETDRDWDWRTAVDDSPEQLYAGWREAVGRSREVLASVQTGDVDSTMIAGLRYVLLNMIEEYARHNGHADLIRESIDGLVGHDPPE